MYDIENKVLDAIEIMVQKRLKEVGNNYYIVAKVIAVNGDNTYDIFYHNSPINNVKARAGLTLAVNDVVYCCVVNGIFSQMFIDLIVP